MTESFSEKRKRLLAEGKIKATLPERRPRPQPEPEPESKFEDTYLDDFDTGTQKWAEAALQRECEIVRNTPEGRRNDALYEASLKIGSIVAGNNGLDEDIARVALESAGLASGLSKTEVQNTLDSGIANGMQNPRQPAPRDVPEQPAQSGAQTIYVPFVQSEPATKLDPFEKAVRYRESQLEVDFEARARVQRRRYEESFEPLELLSLTDALQLPKPDVTWTIEGLHAVGGNTTITAGFKVGKTTLMRNLVKSLVDGEPFLGQHPIRKLDGRVAYFNFEVMGWEFNERIGELGIKATDKLVLVHSRERKSRFDLMVDVVFEDAASMLKAGEVEIVILDPFSGAYYGDENSNSEQNLFLRRLDEFKLAAGITDLFMPVHTGRMVEEGNERARGAAKLDDWADNRWIYTKDADTQERFLKGTVRRLGDLEEQGLQFDSSTGSLSYSATRGSRKDKAGKSIEASVLAFIKANRACGKLQIYSGVPGKTDEVKRALNKLIGKFDVVVRDGKGGKKHHYVAGDEPPTTGAGVTP